ncbi:hypothetical protein MKW94_014725 [Papaver nudicaule]|uniref:Uncharacterized protein n=1 Tax=Papaver nudicaule TaxID=74823 RepID=A0AA41V5U7_PAPNU|nr:hypothetical protein [Papaver nudicaule]
MYVTRPLWLCKQKASTLSNTSPPENPNSGCLVVSSSHEEVEKIVEIYPGNTQKANKHDKLPFLQNYYADVVFDSGDHSDYGPVKSSISVWFIPVIDQPPFSNRYYAIVPTGKYKGQAWTCARKEEVGSSWFGKLGKRTDFKPSVFDHTNIYQQMKIESKHGGFVVKSVAPDGVPPSFLRKSCWNIFYNDSNNLNFHGEASGLNTSLRLRLPNLMNYPISSNHDHSNNDGNIVEVGKWYCPSVFVREEVLNDHSVHPSSFYEMNLEQYWEEIYKSEYDNDVTQGHGNKNTVVVSQVVEKQSFMLFGEKAVKYETNGGVGSDEFVWFGHAEPTEGNGVGLSVAVMEKMKCIQELGGWSGEGDNAARVTKVEKFEGNHGWKRFGCFVLVERFALRRMDGTLVLACDYKHLNKVQCKWESDE